MPNGFGEHHGKAISARRQREAARRADVQAVLQHHAEGLTHKGLLARVGMSGDQLARVLRELQREGLVEKQWLEGFPATVVYRLR